jgi:diguanylate cyclase (GGDEF)-like protein
MAVFTEFFASIDIKTTVFLTGVAVLIQSGVIWFQSLMIKEYHGIRTASLGSLLLGFGMLLASFREVIAPVYSIVLANYLIVMGTAVEYAAVCRFLNVRFKAWLIALSLVPVLVFLPYFTYIRNDVVIRIFLMGAGTAILMGMVAFQLFRLGPVNFSLSARFLSFITMFYTFVLLLRGIGFWFYQVEELLSPSPLTIVNSLSMFIACFLWGIGFLMMVSHRLQADLNEIATVDSLTRVPNRRAMIPLLKAEFSRYSRTQSHFSVLLVDIDHFKYVNDRYGHEMGDIVLRDVAQLMKSALRGQDFICRWGGEEFLILLPTTTMGEAMEIGERLRTLVERSRFRFDGHQVSLTISVGIGNSTSCKDVDHIYRCSDRALYKAKLTRNAVALMDVETLLKV